VDELKIEVGGLAALSRGLRQVSADAPKELRIALNDVSDVFVSHVKPEVPVDTGAARRSVVSRSTRTSARVAVGGKRAPWFPWLDFGGQGRRPGRPARREFLREGRYVYPTLRRIRPLIEAQLDESIGNVIRRAQLEGN
jgi:hypothetical protein